MLYEKAMSMLDDYVQKEHDGNVSSAARALGMKFPAFTRWIKRERIPNSQDLLNILGNLGFQLIPPEDPNENQARLSASSPSDNDPQCALILTKKIADLEQELKNKNQQIEELKGYRSKWEGFKEIKQLEFDAQAQARETEFLKQKRESLLFSNPSPTCAGKEPEESEQLGHGILDPPKQDGSVRG